MKEFFVKAWALLKKPVCYAAIVLIAGLFCFSLIDAIVRCVHGAVFNGIVQIAFLVLAVPGCVALMYALLAVANDKDLRMFLE